MELFANVFDVWVFRKSNDAVEFHARIHYRRSESGARAEVAVSVKSIRESDWKRLRDLKPLLLERFCTRVLAQIERTSSDVAATSHQRYLAVYDLIQRNDKEFGNIFDGLSRSNAIGKVLLMHRAGLLTEEEVAGFSEELRVLLEEATASQHAQQNHPRDARNVRA